ncbi:phage tail protein [Glaciimonas sp. PAMC28666]|uniref:phage tail protein n=1 Tax=Glaciimonas sp. PAMC28666 TaxID=2807626 RepID=UPI0019643C5B|nr:phage tail protein [Glaciimonas sp. PAMC28666]QRX82257.1 phage tail protein [Glaciimonas sp. PAMC28666]
MSSAGQIIGGVVGAVAGFYLGGPQGALVGAQLGMGVGGMVDPPKGPHIVGPRLTDLTTQTSTYGAVIPRVYGTVPIVGNVFWLENNQLKETEHTQRQGKGGGGAESTTFTYSATFAVGLCKGPIQGVRRIWIGPNLVYDATGNDVASVIASDNVRTLFSIYHGTDDQDPDPRMQATLGVANTPAYRGLAYIVFNDLPMADYQNSLVGAQVKAEVFTHGKLEFVMSNISGSFPRGKDDNITGPYKDESGLRVWQMSDFVAGGTPRVVSRYLVPFQGDPILLSSAPVLLPRGSSVARMKADIDVMGILDSAGKGSLGILDANYNLRTYYSAVTSGFAENAVVHQGYVYFACGWPSKISLTRSDLRSGVSVDIPLTIAAVDRNGCRVLGIVGNQLIMGVMAAHDQRDYILIYDKDTLAFIQVVEFKKLYPRVNAPSDLSFTGGHLYYKTFKQDLFRTDRLGGEPVLVMKGEIFGGGTSTFPRYLHSYGDALIGVLYIGSGGRRDVTTWVAQQNVSTVPLSSIIRAEASNNRWLTAEDLDVTDLTNAVRGYTISAIGAIRGGFDPLIGAWPFDIIQSGYKIVCKRRGGTSVVTIPIAKLDARGIGGQPGVQVTTIREMDAVLPSKVALKYFDSAREYDLGEQYAERLNTQSVHIKSMDLPVVLTADEAAQKAEILLYLYWLERYDVTFSLPPEYNYLEPADIITIVAEEATYALRLTQINYTSDSRLECVAKYHSASVYTSAAVGGEGTSTGQTLTLPGPSQYALMDIPLLKDVFDKAGFPVAMAGYLNGWPGGVLTRSDDGGQVWEQIQGFSKPGATMGYAAGQLTDHNGLQIDKASTLSVKVNQALSSVTEGQMLNGANHFAYGSDGRWEIIAAQHCALQANGTYVLTDLLRGRFGSEWATGLHAVNDQLVLLDAVSLQFVASNLNVIGVERTYRGITSGKTMDSDNNRSMTYRGVNLRCLAPVYLNGHRHPTNRDWTLNWIRRTRKGGELRDYIDAALSEASESYVMDIFADDKYREIKRTLTTAAPTLNYTSADQTADFGHDQAVLYIKLYQLSADTGRGTPLITSIAH